MREKKRTERQTYAVTNVDSPSPGLVQWQLRSGKAGLLQEEEKK
jgi:hypothetical protein